MHNESIPDFFLSHASEDKDKAARPLAEALRQRGYKVWYDEFVLRMGDSLRAEIDKGLATCKYGIVVLSPKFFEKRWPQEELNGLFARKTIETRNFLLPVWYNIDHTGVARHSPMIADKVAALFSKGLASVVEEIVKAVEYEQEVEQSVDDRLSTVTNSELDTIRWEKVANLWWLCHDLVEVFRWLYSGIAKETIDVGFRQCCHHAEKLNLYDDIVSQLRQIRDHSASISNLTPELRERYAHDLRVVFNVVAELPKKHQQRQPEGFDSGPG